MYLVNMFFLFASWERDHNKYLVENPLGQEFEIGEMISWIR